MRIPHLVTMGGVSMVLLLFGACSSAASPSGNAGSNPHTGRDASGDVLLSARQSVGARTAQVDVTAELNLPVLGDETAKGNGVVDFAARKAQAHLDAGGIELDGVVDGDVAYLQTPLLGSSTWYRIDTSAGSNGNLPDLWAQVVDPAELFQTLQDASSSMVAVGPEQVNGVQTTHYHGDLDVPLAARGAGASMGSTSVPIDVWIDSQGLVSRVQVSLGSSGQQGSASDSGSGTVTVDLHNYGDPVTVNIPPSDQVKDLSDAFGGLGALFHGG